MWYNQEEPHYDYSTGKSVNGRAIGHFTAMVWDDTRKVGCGVASTEEAREIRGRERPGKSEYSVCRYVTPGNLAR